MKQFLKHLSLAPVLVLLFIALLLPRAAAAQDEDLSYRRCGEQGMEKDHRWKMPAAVLAAALGHKAPYVPTRDHKLHQTLPVKSQDQK